MQCAEGHGCWNMHPIGLLKKQIRAWDNVTIKWNNGHKKRKAQKAKIKEELMTSAWHLSRWWDWCVLRIKRKRQKTVGIKRGILTKKNYR